MYIYIRINLIQHKNDLFKKEIYIYIYTYIINTYLYSYTVVAPAAACWSAGALARCCGGSLSRSLSESLYWMRASDRLSSRSVS